MSDLVSGSGPAGSEHDGDDRSETGTAYRAKVRPIRVTVSAFIDAEHTILVSRRGDSRFVRISFRDEQANDVDLYLTETTMLDRFAEAAKIARQALEGQDDLYVCVTGAEPHQAHEVAA